MRPCAVLGRARAGLFFGRSPIRRKDSTELMFHEDFRVEIFGRDEGEKVNWCS